MFIIIMYCNSARNDGTGGGEGQEASGQGFASFPLASPSPHRPDFWKGQELEKARVKSAEKENTQRSEMQWNAYLNNH